jgi:hypothetical protein
VKKLYFAFIMVLSIGLSACGGSSVTVVPTPQPVCLHTHEVTGVKTFSSTDSLTGLQLTTRLDAEFDNSDNSLCALRAFGNWFNPATATSTYEDGGAVWLCLEDSPLKCASSIFEDSNVLFDFTLPRGIGYFGSGPWTLVDSTLCSEGKKFYSVTADGAKRDRVIANFGYC